MTRSELREEEIWRYYQATELYPKQKLGRKAFCQEHNLDIGRFCNLFIHFYHKSRTQPDVYAKLVPIVREYMKGGYTLSEFAAMHNLKVSDVAGMRTHLNYVDLIEELKQKKSGMNFIQVPTIQTRPPEERQLVRVEVEEPEVLQPRNSVELIIDKGIKVIVAPEVGADKLIKIIELLKDF